MTEISAASAVNLNELSLVCIDNPDPYDGLMPRVYVLKIEGGQTYGYDIVKDLAMQSRDNESRLTQGSLTRLIKPFLGSSIALPPNELLKLENAYRNKVNTDQIINNKAPEDMFTLAKPVVHMHKKAVTDMYAADFVGKAGPEAYEIVSQLTNRHLPRDSRVHIEDSFSDITSEVWDPLRVSRDMFGENKIGELAAILRSQGVLFEDPTFPAHPVSLFQNPVDGNRNANVEQSFRKDQDPFLAGVAGIEWKRPAEVGNVEDTVKMFSGGIDPDDVAQGRLGNCYFLAAIANVASSNMDLIINDLVVEDHIDVGMYGVKFFVNGKWVTVLVDDRIPCIPYGSQWLPIFAGPKDHSGQEQGVKELWPMIFEKAWAKLHLSYESTAGGDTADATNYLTGGLITRMEIEEGTAGRCWDELFPVLNPTENNDLAFCSSNTRYDADPETLQSLGLISGHAYSILGMKVSAINGVRFIQVRNPWGTSEWNGDWSDKCAMWTDDLKVEIGHEDEDDGTFWMSWEDFTTWFSEVQICDPTGLVKCTEGETAQTDVFHSALVANKSAGGPKGCQTFRFNPSCVLTVTQDCPVELSLYQADTRSYGVDEEGNQPDGQQLTVTITDPDGNESQVIDMSPFERVRCTKIYCISEGEYKITVNSWAAGVECPFWITAAGYGAELQAVTLEEPIAAEVQKMQKRVNQEFSCLCCSKKTPRSERSLMA